MDVGDVLCCFGNGISSDFCDVGLGFQLFWFYSGSIRICYEKASVFVIVVGSGFTVVVVQVGPGWYGWLLVVVVAAVVVVVFRCMTLI